MRGLLVVAVCMFSTIAEADAIRAPSECPEPGWVARRHGHGAWCTPRTCSTDADCLGGGTCTQIDRCWTKRVVSSGRRRPQPGEAPRTAWRAGERCSDACNGEDAECREARECVYGEGVSREPVWNADEPPARVEPEPEPEPEPDPEPQAEPQPAPQAEPDPTPEQTTESEGCSLGATSGAWWLFGLLFVRRRTSR